MTANFQGQAPLSFGEGLGVRSNAGISRPIFNNCQPFNSTKRVLAILQPHCEANLVRILIRSAGPFPSYLFYPGLFYLPVREITVRN